METKQHPLLIQILSRGFDPGNEFEDFLSFWKPAEFKKGEHLLRQGEVARFTVFVLSGCLRQYSVNENGQEQIIYFAEENWFAGDLQSMRSRVASNLNLQALENCSVLTINKTNAELVLERFPWWAQLQLAGHQRWMAKLQQQVGQSMIDSAETKYLRLLKDRPKLLQRVPQYQIASFLGISPEALSRIRKKLYTF
ncbi:MAG: putative transcriptional regulator, Crp/Fnr family [Crocinitomicaceae bacterium]|jgi:CRP-like cAMP-binding protein|nr:putative transcriptional regulator, Crp/Fnr family [Crocinitomicaceae bacterium]